LDRKLINFIKKTLRKILTPEQLQIFKNVLCLFYANDLKTLAQIQGTSKWGFHWYMTHYERYFRDLKNNKLNLLEIGVGGYADLREGGRSLRMWKAYFPKGMIYAIDIYDKSHLQENRIEIFQGNQNDPQFLTEVANKIGSLDVVIDDGSHVNEHVITSFKTLFPFLNPGGIYVVEDTQMAYWPRFGGSSNDMNNSNTTTNFFRNLTDGLNYIEFDKPYVPTYFDLHIEAMHFYHNIIFIFKRKHSDKDQSGLFRKEALYKTAIT